MLEIAGGVIIGGLGILLILWLIGLIAENAEEIASVVGFLLAALAVFGVWYFLDSEFPEIDWIKTAAALIGAIFLGAATYGVIVTIKENVNEGRYKNNKFKFSFVQITNIFYVIASMAMVIAIFYALSVAFNY